MGPQESRPSWPTAMSDKSVLLLGCGPVGLALARRLGRERAFRRVITADLSPGRAAAAAELCGDKAVSASLDCTDDIAMSRILDDVGLVLSTIRFPITDLLGLIRTVVEAGASYADCNSDAESLQAVFDSGYLEALAGHRAVGVVPGLGSSPGLTNALTSYLGQRLERVDEATFHTLDDLRRRSLRQWRERLADFGSPALVWRDGEWRQVAPMAECEEVQFPSPWGQVSSYTVGLGPVTLPGTIATLARVSCHRGFSDEEMHEAIRNLVSYGLASDQPVDTPVGPLSPVEFASALFSSSFSSSPEFVPGPLSTSALRLEGDPVPTVRQARVSGLLRGRSTLFTLTYYFPDEGDEENTAAPLAIGARMLITRELPAPGVFPPESLDPAPFLWDMERRGVEIQLRKDVED